MTERSASRSALRRGLSAVARAAAVAAVTAGAAMAPGVASAETTTGTGDATPYIVGGHDATQTYSFVASLQWLKNGDPNAHRCGGALIAKQWVLTAAHCVTNGDNSAMDPALFHVRVGSTDRTTGGSTANVAEIHVHPNWNWDHLDADLALLKLATPITDQAPVPLSPVADPAVGSSLRVIGWGYTTDGATTLPTKLQELDTTVLPDTTCAVGDYGITPGDFCTNNPGGVSGPCGGDSGTPAIVKADGRWALQGLDSRGIGDVCGETPDVMPSVPYYRNWIRVVTASPEIPPQP